MVSLYPHQKEALEAVKDRSSCAFYHDMGLGKTFTGAEKMHQLGARINLVVCQKSKIQDWVDHFRKYYNTPGQAPYQVHDLTKWKVKDFKNSDKFITCLWAGQIVYIINYELLWRRPDLKYLEDFTLMLDESSLIQNRNSKRSKFILKLHPSHVILLSGTPCSGKYELLWSQLHLLGWKISEETYWNQYIDTHYEDVNGFPLRIVDGYKNVDRLKRKMREHGCHFLKTDEVIDLPDQIFQKIDIPVSKAYQKFRKDRIVNVDYRDLVGDTTLTKLLYERMLCGVYSGDKLNAFKDLVESTSDRLIVFYNFTAELEAMQGILLDEDYEYSKRFSVVNGSDKHLQNYEDRSDSITFVQYQAGAMGLNLQKACRIIYFTPPLSSELFQQSMKRIHRIGQGSTCFYYKLICKGSVEERIYGTLKKRKDYTEALFECDQ